MTNHRALMTLAGAAALAALGSSPAHADDPPLGPVEPTADEQAGIYALNRARHDPTAYGLKIKADLSAIAPQPPLAVNTRLTGSARFKANEMLNSNYFAHVSPVTGFGANELAVQNGYDVFGAGLGNNWTSVNTIESIAKGVKLIPTCTSALNLLVVDKGVPGSGHRVHLMALNAQFQAHREIGFGRASKGTTYLYAVHTANVSPNDTFLTGVVSQDKNGNGVYDKGEGLGGVTVDAGGGRTAVTMAAGGWSILVPRNGIYGLTCSGGTFAGQSESTVSVGTSNREVDFVSGRSLGEVDFMGTAGPPMSIDAVPSVGDAPLDVSFNGTSTHQGTSVLWDFGDGNASQLAALNHRFTIPGLYTVRLLGVDSTGVDTDVAVIAANGPQGAGPGTTLPASAALTVTKVKMKAGFAKVGHDTVTFTGKFEMPAGWTPGLSDATVDLAGLRIVFPLGTTDTGTGTDGQTSKFTLKYAHPKGGAPLGAGVIATVTVSISGNLAPALSWTDVREANETRMLQSVPFAVMLGEFGWVGTANIAVKSKVGVSSTGTLAK